MSGVSREVFRFSISGIGAVFVDFITYYVLIDFLSFSLAKGISFLTGSLVSFTANKYWTFEKHEKSVVEVVKFYSLYLFSLGINVVLNSLVLDYSVNLVHIAFLVATGASVVINFIGLKYWVYKT
jgi:putative flippase GtrA